MLNVLENIICGGSSFLARMNANVISAVIQWKKINTDVDCAGIIILNPNINLVI